MVDPNEFEEMNPDEQIRVFALSPIRERGDLILHSHEPSKIVRSLSSEELYLISREMDREERSELLKFADMRQLAFFADIDCWDADRINGSDFVGWLDTLRQADERQLLSWMQRTDDEGLIAGFMQFMSVLKPTWEYAIDEVIGDRNYFTLDMQYYVLVEDENLETVKRALELLFENNRNKYVALLEGLLSEMEYEIEESAYRNREIRLADAGFPDLESASRVYVPLDEKGFHKFEKKVRDEVYQQAAARRQNEPRADYPVLWKFERTFLDDAITALGGQDPLILEGVYEELAWLSNKIIVCHGMDFTSEEKVKWAVRRTRSLMNFGLDVLAGGDVNEAAAILERHWLETIFRFGVGRIQELGKSARTLLSSRWKNEREDLLAFLEAPYDSIMEGLLEKIPRCYDFEVTENVQHLRDFQSRTDFSRARMSLEQMECIHDFLAEHAPVVFQKDKLALDAGEVETTLFEAMGTLFIRHVLTGTLSLKSVSRKEIEAFLKKAFTPRDGQYLVLQDEVKEEFLTRYFSEEQVYLLRSLWGLVFQQMQEQMNSFVKDNKAGLYYFSCFKHLPEDDA